VTQQSTQPRHPARRSALLPVPDPRPRHEVQPRLRRDLPHRGHQGDPDTDPGAERERPCRTLGAHSPRRLPRPDSHPRPPPVGCVNSIRLEITADVELVTDSRRESPLGISPHINKERRASAPGRQTLPRPRRSAHRSDADSQPEDETPVALAVRAAISGESNLRTPQVDIDA
jgi:hypothetical protein